MLSFILTTLVGFCVRVSRKTNTPFKIAIGNQRHLYAPFCGELFNIDTHAWYDGKAIVPDISYPK